MNADIVAQVLKLLTPEVLGRAAPQLGASGADMARATAAAVPGLLATLAGLAGTPAGAQKLAEAARAQDPNVLYGLRGEGGFDHGGLVADGKGLLARLFGQDGLTGLADGVSRVSGLTTPASASLLGMLTPLVMATLGNQARASNLDAAGLAGFLAAQTPAIKAQLPPRLSEMLAGEGLLKNLDGAAATATAAVNRLKPASGGLPGWLGLAAAALAVTAGLAWYLAPTAPALRESVRDVARDLPRELTIDGVNLADSARSLFDGLRGAVQSVTDADSARLALPKLRDASAQLEALSTTTARLPAAGRAALAALVRTARPSLEQMFTASLAIPGVSEVLKPAIDGLRARLDALEKA
jgi:hypothetical protein